MNITKRYQQSFLLDEGKLHKIVATITSFELPPDVRWAMAFHVTRQDGTEHTYAIIDEILEDDNCGRRAIQKLKLDFDGTSEEHRHLWSDLPRCSLTFDADAPSWADTVTAEMSNVEKASGLVLAEELDIQINRTLQRGGRRLTALLSELNWLIPGLLIAGLLSLLALKGGGSFTLPPSQGQTLEGKIDQLLALARYDAATRRPPLFLLGTGASIVLLAILLVAICGNIEPFSKLAKGVGRSCFYWGDQIPAYDRRARLISNIVWILVAGFIVSGIAGVVVAFLTK